jgi:hypothetical protein
VLDPAIKKTTIFSTIGSSSEYFCYCYPALNTKNITESSGASCSVQTSEFMIFSPYSVSDASGSCSLMCEFFK